MCIAGGVAGRVAGGVATVLCAKYKSIRIRRDAEIWWNQGARATDKRLLVEMLELFKCRKFSIKGARNAGKTLEWDFIRYRVGQGILSFHGGWFTDWKSDGDASFTNKASTNSCMCGFIRGSH